ncbi:MAG: pyridoxamine 5'-phosphate oxidase family protein [Haloarculaceae archaeon]
MSSNFEALRGHRMIDSEIDRLLVEEGVGVLSLADGGVPYGVALSFGYDGDDRLYFVFVGHSDEGRKVTYAERSEAASFLAYDLESRDEWRSVVVEGPLRRIDPDEWDAAREAMADNAFRPQLLTGVDVRRNPRVWALTAEERSGRAVGTAADQSGVTE